MRRAVIIGICVAIICVDIAFSIGMWQWNSFIKRNTKISRDLVSTFIEDHLKCNKNNDNDTVIGYTAVRDSKCHCFVYSEGLDVDCIGCFNLTVVNQPGQYSHILFDQCYNVDTSQFLVPYSVKDVPIFCH